MTGAEIAPLVAILGAVALINLAFAWLFTRGDRDPADFLGSAREVPEDATAELERDRDRGSDPDPGPSRDGATDFTVNAGESEPTGDPPPLDADGETVVCRHCGAENRPGYRYCRWCVRSGFVDDGPGGTAGATMTNRSL
ncbi:zinc ribbon domain-containing protein [Halorubrum lacusprofundi]|jgi:hypothetical protein|uniref:zinc ribbon domain-containing protein n=1 Tax=Halorubrum lacusprofundi TaxID=2247 RepID=UPI000B5A900C|nr:zinc ribbon domain-containing protein [Halorubrum lacusprofundi]MCG1008150.1 zinc ribbon domain-containing protein [Halorubrum lacusprofundi]